MTRRLSATSFLGTRLWRVLLLSAVLGFGSAVAARAQSADDGASATAASTGTSSQETKDKQDKPAEAADQKKDANLAPPPALPAPPMYQDRRFEEDWTPQDWTRPHANARDVFDKIKAIKLNDSGSVWIGFGGQGRGRMAHQSTVTFGGPGDFTPTMWTWRARGYADLHLGNSFRVYTEGIYSNSSIQAIVDTLGAPSARLGNNAPNKNGDFLNLFGEYKTKVSGDYQLGLWGGRRELQFGHERILSPGNWLLNRHTYDGGGGWLQKDGKRLEAFVVRPRIPVPDMWNDRDDSTTFWGLLYTTGVTSQPTQPGARPEHVTIQPYLMGIHRKDVEFVQGKADEDRYMGGVLMYGDVGSTGFDFEFEGMYQHGRYENRAGNGTIEAYAATGIVGYRFVKAKFLPRPYFSVDYASGDRDPNDDKLGTFDPLYPLAYAFFGFHAAVERKNLVATAMNVDAVLTRNLYLRVSYWPGLWRAQKGDGVYDSFGNIARRPDPQSKGGNSPDLTEASTKLGQQFDMGLAWLPTHHLLLYVTYLHLFAGQFWADTQTAPPTDMNGLMALAQFNF